MSKASEAFRTISEVADDLEIPKHVLRFWEVKFPQIRPMKRGGGRRYYRPEDLDLLRGIRQLLHAEGYTIKGVQKILREQGVDSVKKHGRAIPEKTVAAPAGKRAKAESVAEASKAVARDTSAPVALARKPRDAIKAAIAELEALRAVLLADAAAEAPPAVRSTRAAR